MTPDRPVLSRTLGVLLTLEGMFLVVMGVLMDSRALSGLPGGVADSLPLLQSGLFRLGLLCSGLFTAVWGLHEILFRRQGPVALVGVLCLLPLLAPFGMLGYGAGVRPWLVALAASQEGVPIASSPLFTLLTTAVIPSWGWPGLFTLNLLAGLGAALVWLLLPKDCTPYRRSLVVVLGLVQPVSLLAMGTGLEPVCQSLFLSLSAVLVLRGTAGNETRMPLILAAAISLGVAIGLGSSSVALFPVLLMLLFWGCPDRVRAATSALLFAAISLGLGLALIYFGESQTELELFLAGGDQETFAQLTAALLSPPLLVLSLTALIGLLVRWGSLTAPQGRAAFLAWGGAATLMTATLVTSSEVISLAVAAPFLALAWTLGAPRILLGVMAPLVLLSGFLTLGQTEKGVGVVRGPISVEAEERFVDLRRAQQVLLMAPKEPTEVILGRDWPRVAVLRPKWEREGQVLRSPSHPVRFHATLSREEFERLSSEGSRLIILPGEVDRIRELENYDPLEGGATLWDPKKVYYR